MAHRLTAALAAALLTVGLSACGPSEPSTVPDVVGMTAKDAKTALAAEGYTADINGGEIYGGNSPVTAQSPEGGTELDPYGQHVKLTVEDPNAKPDDEAESGLPETEIPPLADDVASAYTSAWGVDNLIDLAGEDGVTLPFYAITSFTDAGAGQIRVNVQEDITKDVKKQIGENIFGMVGADFPDLNVVIVRGTDQIDANVFRSSIPALQPAG